MSLDVEDIKANNRRSLGALCALTSQMPGRNALFMCLFMSHTFTNEQQQQHCEGSSKLYVEAKICPAGLQIKVSNDGNQEQCGRTCVKRRKILRGADSADILAVKTEEPVSDWN